MMPLGKVVGKYSTLRENSGGVDYRAIATIMTRRGQKMNFTSARNHFLSGMERIADAILVNTGNCATPEHIAKVAKNPDFQSYVMDVLEEVYSNT